MVTRLESIDLNLLVALNALLEERHVTNAGARIHIGQSAMSGILRRLRGYFGDELLVRVGNELQLTPFAESLVPAARAAYDAANVLFAAGAEFDPQTSERQFSVAMSDYTLTRVAGPLLQRIDAGAPRVRIAFEPLPNTFIRDPDGALIQHDVMVLPLEYLPAYSGSSMPLFDDDFVLVMAAENPLAHEAPLTVEGLLRAPQLRAALGPRNQLRPLAGADAHAAMSSVEPHVSVSSYLGMSHLIRNSRYWGLMPRSLARIVCSPDDFHVSEPPFVTAGFTEHAFWHPSRERDAGLDWLRAQIALVAATLR